MHFCCLLGYRLRGEPGRLAQPHNEETQTQTCGKNIDTHCLPSHLVEILVHQVHSTSGLSDRSDSSSDCPWGGPHILLETPVALSCASFLHLLLFTNTCFS